MARKTATVHKAIAEEFKLYLSINPGVGRKKRIAAFDHIADKHQTRNGNGDRRQSPAIR